MSGSRRSGEIGSWFSSTGFDALRVGCGARERGAGVDSRTASGRVRRRIVGVGRREGGLVGVGARLHSRHAPEAAQGEPACKAYSNCFCSSAEAVDARRPADVRARFFQQTINGWSRFVVKL